MRVKEISILLFSTLLLTMSISSNSHVYADTLQQEKQEIINELKEIKEEGEISKKSKKHIESSIKKLEKSLKPKFWKDESTVNFKHGKKVLNADKNAVEKLEKILNDKKTDEENKEDILGIILEIVELEKTLIENSISSLSEVIMSDKALKKLDKAIVKFEKGNEFLENENYEKALKYYGKAWDQIKKTLKDPHFKKMKIVELEGVGDLNFDNIPDVYLKVSKSTKENKPKEIEVKITDACVNGIIHDDAKMKIGLSTPVQLSTEFFDEEFQATNKWFKQNDPDKRIDPVIITTVSEYFSFPVSGDDLIQTNTENDKESFSYSSESIPEIGDQAGWEGKFQFDAPPGEYFMHFWMPLTEPTNEGDSCNFVSSFSIGQEFE